LIFVTFSRILQTGKTHETVVPQGFEDFLGQNEKHIKVTKTGEGKESGKEARQGS
jgi:hypothetical protein